MTLGTLVGVLPGVGALAAISLLLPVTYHLSATAALVMLAGVYYGAQYGGSVAAILLRLPGTPQSAITCLDGNPMAREGRAGIALFAAMSSSFVGGAIGITILVLGAPLLADLGTRFGAADYFAMMLLGLIAASTVGTGSPVKGLAMVVLGMLLGCIGTDANSGELRFTFGSTELFDGISLVALAMGMFGVAEMILGVDRPAAERASERVPLRSLVPARDELLSMGAPMVRGAGVGAFFGALPGTGGTIATFISYALEKRVAREPQRFGKGAIEGVAAPESANNAAAITAFIPTLTLGIPGDVIMALMLGAMVIHGIQPGPMMLVEQPALFWGLIVSFAVGNLLLLILNLPLIGIWVSLLRIPFRFLYPAIIVFICLGVYSVDGSLFDIVLVAVIGAFGTLMALLRFNPALLLLGFVLGPLIEVNMRRALLLARGDLMVFFQRPVSAVFLSACVALLLWSAWNAWRSRGNPPRD